MAELGKSIREARGRVKITQAVLAEKVGLTQAMIALLETGRKNGSQETAERLTQALIQEALPDGFKLEKVVRAGEEPDGRYVYDLIVKKGTARYRLPIKGLEPLETKALWKGRLYELRVFADLLDAATKALLDGEAGQFLKQVALPVPAQIAGEIMRRGVS